jgi:predicted hotdog family 3-hydroxylacyl-ACP dehydratase
MFLENLPKELDAQFIYQLIPHRKKMMLLERITAWDNEKIVCTTKTHLSKEHPLRVNNKLSMIHCIEYGAQAAALHGAIISFDAQRNAKPMAPLKMFLAVVRDFSFIDEDLDSIGCELIFKADQVLVSKGAQQYLIRSYADKAQLSEGIVTLISEGYSS